jgi:hypothetical protein
VIPGGRISEVAASAVAAEGFVANDANATLDAANRLPTHQESKLDPMPVATTPRVDRTVIARAPIFAAYGVRPIWWPAPPIEWPTAPRLQARVGIQLVTPPP